MSLNYHCGMQSHSMLCPLLGDSGKRVFFAIDAVGVDVTLYSTHAKEGEMLLLPGSMLRVEEAVPAQHGPGPDDTLWEYRLVSKADDGQNLDFVHSEWSKQEVSTASNTNQSMTSFML